MAIKIEDIRELAKEKKIRWRCHNPLHLVCAVGEGFVWLITAYFPSEEEWMPDFKTRRKNK
ncbi:hypothetical protein [Caldicellulosiruptor acetigenus]|uniref:hypothetical protein n=1 Tax=Caldicellulosiruptor acetigenus TaxID=301953 RepID=UPI0003F65DDF|nr:hypothetical protein [Caldicellulosiruptor acetigenus]WAM37146.1 hypothetical protein OTK01_000968 [Caldicellulosiruptor acetigenus]